MSIRSVSLWGNLPFLLSAESISCGRGKARLSILLLAVNGNPTSSINSDGTIYSGRIFLSDSRISWIWLSDSRPLNALFSRIIYAIKRLLSCPSSCAMTIPLDTAACWFKADSISPGSIRNPLSWIWSSFRPIYSSVPSSVHFPISPVL